MRKPSLALVPVLLLAMIGCSQPTEGPDPGSAQLESHPENVWRATLGLPTAAAACRAAGYPAEEIADIIHHAEDVGIDPASLANALAATAQSARQYGPIGDLSGFVAETMYRNQLRGLPLYRLIQAQHATYGSYRMQVPPVQNPMPWVPPYDPNQVEEWGRSPGGAS